MKNKNILFFDLLYILSIRRDLYKNGVPLDELQKEIEGCLKGTAWAAVIIRRQGRYLRDKQAACRELIVDEFD